MAIFSKIKNKIFNRGNYDIKRIIAKHLNIDSPVIIEAGAHIGSDTTEMSKIWPQASIHAFEPIPEIYSKLVANTKKCINVKTYPIALSNLTGTVEINVSSGSSDGSSSLLKPKEHFNEHPDVKFERKTTISTITLDEWAANNNISKVDFAWLDMQGFEFPVLKASESILKTINVIYTEVSLKEMYEGAALYPEFKELLNSKGFRVELEEMPYNDFGNVLFVKD
ncbi:MAG: FkbM family methyltransferase [Flammeovirgaceae bacterium]